LQKELVELEKQEEGPPSCSHVRKENFHTNKAIEGNGRRGALLAQKVKLKLVLAG
jgi:hypothetical protein